MTSIRVMVVDDESVARNRLLALLQRQPDVEIVGTAADGEEALELIRRMSPDLLFLDVEMPGLDGFAVLDQLAAAVRPITILVTAHGKYAVQAFDAHAFDYLLKPFSDARFEHAVARARQLLDSADRRALTEGLCAASDERQRADRRPEYLEHLTVKTNGRVTFLDLEDVDWVEAAGVYIYVHVGAHQHLYRSSVTQWLKRVDPHRFVRIHRSAAVNTSRIRELRSLSHGDFALFLKDGTKLTLSRAYRPTLESWLRQPI